MSFDNIYGANLRVTTRFINTYPYETEVEPVFLEGSNNMQIKTYLMKGGYAINLFWELANYFKFNYTLVPEVDGYGFRNATQYSIDLFIGGFGLVASRAAIVNPTFVIGYAKLAIFLNHKLGVKSAKSNPLLSPFKTSLWKSLIGIVAILNLTALFFGHFEISIYDAQFYFSAIILQKGSNIRCKRVSVFLAFWSIWFTSFIVYSSYNSLIVSIKTVETGFIENLRQFISSNYKIFWDGQSGLNEMVLGLSQSNPLMKQIYEKRQKSDLTFENYPQAFKQISNIPAGLVSEDINGIYRVTNSMGFFPCYFSPLDFGGIKYIWSMYMGKQSKYRPVINFGIVKFEERGISSRLKKKWLPMKVQCFTQPEYIGVSFADSSKAFIFIYSSILFSTFLLLVEKFL